MLTRVAIFAAALAVVCVAPAFAGGDDYDASNDTEGAGPAYFGFVRDHRGSPVSDAQVVLRPKMGDPVTIKTNVLGSTAATSTRIRHRTTSRSVARSRATSRPRCIAARRPARKTCSSKPNAPCSGCSSLGLAAMVRDASLRGAPHHEVRMRCAATYCDLILRSALSRASRRMAAAGALLGLLICTAPAQAQFADTILFNG